MNNVTQETLENIESLLVRNFSSPRDALLAAYRLGKFDGMLQMAEVGEAKTKELLQEAA